MKCENGVSEAGVCTAPEMLSTESPRGPGQVGQVRAGKSCCCAAEARWRLLTAEKRGLQDEVQNLVGEEAEIDSAGGGDGQHQIDGEGKAHGR